MQYGVWRERHDRNGLLQLLLKAALTAGFAWKTWVVFDQRAKLAASMRQELRQYRNLVPGVDVEEDTKTTLTPHLWPKPKNKDSTATDDHARVDAIYNGIFRKHFCRDQKRSEEIKPGDDIKIVVEKYIGVWSLLRSLWAHDAICSSLYRCVAMPIIFAGTIVYAFVPRVWSHVMEEGSSFFPNLQNLTNLTTA